MAGEALIDLFSSLSLKRKHGMLRLNAAGAKYELAFFDGRIIDVRRESGDAAREICRRLVKGGLIHEKVHKLVQSKPVSVGQLFDLLVSKKFVSAGDFQRAKRAHDFDILHSLGFTDDATFEFLARDMRPDPRFPHAISPTQLLLDFCELQVDEERYQSNFGAGSAPIVRRASDPKGLSDFERGVWQIINGTRRASDLFHSLLSEYEVKEGLLALLDRELISVGKSPSQPVLPISPTEADDTTEDNLALSEVEENSDMLGKIAGEAVESILEAFEDNITLTELTDAVLEPIVAAPKKVAAPQPAPQSVAVAPKPVPVPRAPTAQPIVAEVKPSVVAPAEVVQAKAVPQETIVTDESVGALTLQFFSRATELGLRNALFEMNHLFLEKKNFEQITLVIILAYLVALAILCSLGIGLIDPWFRALAEFTSAGSTFMIE